VARPRPLRICAIVVGASLCVASAPWIAAGRTPTIIGLVAVGCGIGVVLVPRAMSVVLLPLAVAMAALLLLGAPGPGWAPLEIDHVRFEGPLRILPAVVLASALLMVCLRAALATRTRPPPSPHMPSTR